MTVASVGRHWEMMAPLMHSSCNDSVMQHSSLAQSVLMQCLRLSRSVMQVYTPCLAVCPTHFSQLNLNPTNLETTVEPEWILAFFNDVTITLLSHSTEGHFTIFQLHGLSGWFVPKITKSCLNLSYLRPKYCRSLFSRLYTTKMFNN